MKYSIIIRSRRTAFARDGHPALKAYPCGKVQANTFGTAREWEEWTLHPIHDGVTALQSYHGKFLSAKPNGEARADAESIGEWEQWQVSKTVDQWVCFQSFHGKYLVADCWESCGEWVKADREQVQEWEEWVIIEDDPHSHTNPGHTAQMAIRGTLIGLGVLAELAFP